MADDTKVVCRTPTEGKRPTRIDRWKFDTVREAILEVVPPEGDGILFRDLPKLVKGKLPRWLPGELGSIGWYATTVKLELEVRGEIARVEGSKPQRLIRLKRSAEGGG